VSCAVETFTADTQMIKVNINTRFFISVVFKIV
jgi:hypothetical protein